MLTLPWEPRLCGIYTGRGPTVLAARDHYSLGVKHSHCGKALDGDKGYNSAARPLGAIVRHRFSAELQRG